MAVPTTSDSATLLAERRATLVRIYESHFARVVRYIGIRIGDFSEAEDLTSEVFIRALRSLDSYRETGAPMEAWVFRIAHNMVVDHLRRKDRRPIPAELDEAHSVPSSEDPERDAERREEAQRLHDAMRHLTEAQKQVLSLRFGGEMSSEEVAQVLGKKAGAVRTMQNAAIQKLRNILDKQGKSGGSR